MATRWGVPCGCILVFDFDAKADKVLNVKSEKKCGAHSDVDDADLHAACTAFCVAKAAAEQEAGNGG